MSHQCCGKDQSEHHLDSSKQQDGMNREATIPSEQIDTQDTHPTSSSLRRMTLSSRLELTDRLQKQLRHGKYLCQICLFPVLRCDSLWDCSSCYSIFHLKCIHAWIKKVSAIPVPVTSNDRAPDDAAGSTENNGRGVRQAWHWSCPSCRSDYAEPCLPRYHCWCGRYFNPEPNRPDHVPHSCFQPCPLKPPYAPPGAVPKPFNCGHPCPLFCHPGPCPKCAVVIGNFPCRCGKEGRIVQCWAATETWSCGKVCGRSLSCQHHQCDQVCHTGPCPPCTVMVDAQCVCEKETRQMACGVRRWRCQTVCGKLLPCGRHRCDEVCHPPQAPFTTSPLAAIADDPNAFCHKPCPLDPSVLHTCPCGRHRLTEQQKESRQSCTAPIPSCGSLCQKPLFGCPHYCQRTCHEGPCDPCPELMSRACRCGTEVQAVRCVERDASEFRCLRVCRTKKRCKRHRCLEVCCPDYGRGPNTEDHLCVIVCNRLLSCGVHHCDAFCHEGPCAPCEVVVRRPPVACACGFTVLSYPLLCGMESPECPVACGKKLPCGHTCSSSCHYGECPKCCVLVDRFCAGGHRLFQGVQCWKDSLTIFCRSRCGKVLDTCPSHRCSRLCHSPVEGCGPCLELCGQDRQWCNHSCQVPCHTRTNPCPDIPCRVIVEVHCGCGFKTTTVQCGRYSEMTGLPSVICDSKCSDEKRKKQLAEAFGDVQVTSDRTVAYDDELVGWASSNRPLIKELDGLGDEAMQYGTSYTPPIRDQEHLLWIDYYFQLYWRLRTGKRKDRSDSWAHVVLQKELGESWTPTPKLSELPFDSLPSFSRTPKPQLSFIRFHILRCGQNSCLVICDNVPMGRTTLDVVRRLGGVRNHWRLRWRPNSSLPRRQRANQQLLKPGGDYTVSNSSIIDASSLPSNRGLIQPEIVIEAADERLGTEIFDVLNQCSSYFGHATLVRPSSGSAYLERDCCRESLPSENGLTNRSDDEGWKTVGR